MSHPAPSAAAPLSLAEARTRVRAGFRAPEEEVVRGLIPDARPRPHERRAIEDQARSLINTMRTQRDRFGGVDAFLQEYGLNTEEGVALMCLAEALLRIPDAETANALIRDKIGLAKWEAHMGKSEALFVNASTWALMLTGRVLSFGFEREKPVSVLERLVNRTGEPVIRQAMLHAMRIMGKQFVLGRTITEALDRARGDLDQGYRHSFDMLGEGARTADDAQRYYESYQQALATIAKLSKGRGPIEEPGLSVKLSALEPRYEWAQRDEAIGRIVARLLPLAQQAKAANINLCVDAEEADRLDMSLDILQRVFLDPSLQGWEGFGLALQGYQKRARAVVDWLAALGRAGGRRLMVRLVKGAYWDTEVKHAQVEGLADYPVFTRKVATDVSYLACARAMLAAPDAIYSQFATHNAHSVAAIMTMAGDTPFEFQRLHGMGEPLYHQIIGPKAKTDRSYACRIYAPVGTHEDLLPYLVRRLLENGANSSFVNRISQDNAPLDDLIADPVASWEALEHKRHPRIPLPIRLYGTDRENAVGTDIANEVVRGPLWDRMRALDAGFQNLSVGDPVGGQPREITRPADHTRLLGMSYDATAAQTQAAFAAAAGAQPDWDRVPVEKRAAILNAYGDLLERETPHLLALIAAEAGRTIVDGIAEVREAVDFARYYAARAVEMMGEHPLPGPTGEANLYQPHGRGVILAISPWNFPLAIFSGQILAALVTGNAVVAKPAEQTGLIANYAVELMQRAGVPDGVLHLLPGPGKEIGAAALSDPHLAGVVFTGSVPVAKLLQRQLAERDGPILPLIAETGGQNAMIVDSSALPEQVVDDVVMSAFRSAGQRCSALRVLFVQEEAAERTLRMLKGATALQRLGDPLEPETDIGPVIDATAQARLLSHIEAMTSGGARAVAYAGKPPASLPNGTFVAPHIFEIDSLDRLDCEKFGPLLHVVRYHRDDLDRVVDAINATGYGLTMGVHSRVESTIQRVRARAKVGNLYINRNIIGAIVGVQPFGGEGLSGTGPKAGGPHYLSRFIAERHTSIDTTASGGNTTLMTLTDS